MSKSKLPKNPRRFSQMQVWKSIRKGPTPPGRTIQPKDRDLADEDAEREIERWSDWHGEDLEEFEE